MFPIAGMQKNHYAALDSDLYSDLDSDLHMNLDSDLCWCDQNVTLSYSGKIIPCGVQQS